jgi:hypothetical protein
MSADQQAPTGTYSAGIKVENATPKGTGNAHGVMMPTFEERYVIDEQGT